MRSRTCIMTCPYRYDEKAWVVVYIHKEVNTLRYGRTMYKLILESEYRLPLCVFEEFSAIKSSERECAV